MDLIDRVFGKLYALFVADGGLDQTDHIVNEDFERMERQVAYCIHSEVKRTCHLCNPGPKPLPAVFQGYRGEDRP